MPPVQKNLILIKRSLLGKRRQPSLASIPRVFIKETLRSRDYSDEFFGDIRNVNDFDPALSRERCRYSLNNPSIIEGFVGVHNVAMPDILLSYNHICMNKVETQTLTLHNHNDYGRGSCRTRTRTGVPGCRRSRISPPAHVQQHAESTCSIASTWLQQVHFCSIAQPAVFQVCVSG